MAGDSVTRNLFAALLRLISGGIQGQELRSELSVPAKAQVPWLQVLG